MTARSFRKAAPPAPPTRPCSNLAPGFRRPIGEPVRQPVDEIPDTDARDALRLDPGKSARAPGAFARGMNEAPGRAGRLVPLLVAVLAAGLAETALAGSPFATGANATQQQLVAILTPLAAVAVMVSGAMAWFGRLSWWWMVAVVIGTVLVFGGPQIVSWIRGLFGV